MPGETVAGAAATAVLGVALLFAGAASVAALFALSLGRTSLAGAMGAATSGAADSGGKIVRFSASGGFSTTAAGVSERVGTSFIIGPYTIR